MSLLDGKWIKNIFIQEVPTGLVNGINDTFTLSNSPIFSSAHLLYLNGLIMIQGVHYSISGNTITFTNPPQTGQLLLSAYIRSLT